MDTCPSHCTPATPAHVQGARILEGLAASGLRSLRYALELPGVSRVDANDLDPLVVASMRDNIKANGPQAVQRIMPTCSDVRLLMINNPGVRACVRAHARVCMTSVSVL